MELSSREYPQRPEIHGCHETICQAIYAPDGAAGRAATVLDVGIKALRWPATTSSAKPASYPSTSVTERGAAIELASRFEDAYRQARPRRNRLLNQSIFERLHVDPEAVPYPRLAEPFAHLLADDLLVALDQETKNPDRNDSGQGSFTGPLVELLRVYSNPDMFTSLSVF